MDQDLITTIRTTLEGKPTEELRRIYDVGDIVAWSPEAFEAMRQILVERGEIGLGPLPSMRSPAKIEPPEVTGQRQPAEIPPIRYHKPFAKDRKAAHARLAARETRLIAVLVDGVVALITCGPGWAIMGASSKGNPWQWFGLALLIVGAVALLIFQCTLLTKQGQTAGKSVMGVRIVRSKDGGNPGFWRAAGLRYIVPGLIGAIPCVGGLFGIVDICYIFGEDRRCLHDYMAGTRVVEA